MAEISPPFNPVFDIPDPVEAARQLAASLRGYQARTAIMLEEQARQISLVHQNFLRTRQQSLSELSQLLQSDILNRLHLPAGLVAGAIQKSALFSRQQLEEFASGDIVNCLGKAYSVYKGRRSPRIPTGRLLLMSRVSAIEGVPGIFDSGTIEVEYDCPNDPWFFDPGIVNGIPNAIIMEIALQPCGFLSAYLQTPLIDSQEDLYFRNLDGSGRLLSTENIVGKTITTRARLLETSNGAGMILQSFSFELAVDQVVFYDGEASFGYFPAAALKGQAGLDGSSSRPAWLHNAPGAMQSAAINRVPHSSNQMDTGFDRINMDPVGGDAGMGYAYAHKTINPVEWFFSAHFYQDPVMPGSLGVEALYQLLNDLAVSREPSLHGINQSLDTGTSTPLIWKYRGQVQPANREMEFEVHLQKIDKQAGQETFFANGSAWVDGKRIYEVKNMALTYAIN